MIAFKSNYLYLHIDKTVNIIYYYLWDKNNHYLWFFAKIIYPSFFVYKNKTLRERHKFVSLQFIVLILLINLSYFMWQVALRAVLQSYQQSYLNLGIIFKLSCQDHHCNKCRTACKEVWPMWVLGINTCTCEIIFKNSVKHVGRAQGCPLRLSSRRAQIERDPVGS